MATWLQDAGYRTALVGKYLNRYPKEASESHVPPGWDEWTAFASSDEDEGGRTTAVTPSTRTALPSFMGSSHPNTRPTCSRRGDRFRRSHGRLGRPLLPLYCAICTPRSVHTSVAPHRGVRGCAGAAHPVIWRGRRRRQTGLGAGAPALDDEQIALLDDRYRRRLRSLLAVDEMVASLIETLDAAGALENTYIVFTSDNGYHLGEHGLPIGKQSPYDESLRVPLIVRGPGVPPGAVVDGIALNIDLAPTFAELAGASPADFVDGRSLVPLLDSDPPAEWRHGFLVEHYDRTLPQRLEHPGPITMEEPSEDLDEFEEGDEVNGITPIDSPPYLALRTEQYLYVEYANGERELYDLHADPYQLQNLAATADPALLAGARREPGPPARLRRCGLPRRGGRATWCPSSRLGSGRLPEHRQRCASAKTLEAVRVVRVGAIGDLVAIEDAIAVVVRIARTGLVHIVLIAIRRAVVVRIEIRRIGAELELDRVLEPVSVRVQRIGCGRRRRLGTLVRGRGLRLDGRSFLRDGGGIGGGRGAAGSAS